MFELSKQTTSINAILTGITMFVLKNKQQEINILVKQDYEDCSDEHFLSSFL